MSDIGDVFQQASDAAAKSPNPRCIMNEREERQIFDAKKMADEIEALRNDYQEYDFICNITSYHLRLFAEGLRSLTIAQTSSDAADAARYRHLKEHCSYCYHEGHNPPSPREIGIEFYWQDSTPARPDMDSIIDREIEERRVLAESDADEGASLTSTDRGGQ